jgi:hypothetical protein
MKLYNDDIAERMSASDNGYESDSGDDCGFYDYDEAVNFAATLTVEKGGAYAVVEIKDMFAPADNMELPEPIESPVVRLHYNEDGSRQDSVGTAAPR